MLVAEQQQEGQRTSSDTQIASASARYCAESAGWHMGSVVSLQLCVHASMAAANMMLRSTTVVA